MSASSKILRIGAVALPFALPLSHGAGWAQNARAAEHVTSSTLGSYVAQTKDGLVARSVTADPSSRTLMVRRDRSGEAEVHEAMNDVIIARKGKVDMIIGGRVEGGRQTTPGEWIGGRIIGGRTYTLQPGDVMWIPSGIPHHMILKPGRSFTYLVVKSANSPSPPSR